VDVSGSDLEPLAATTVEDIDVDRTRRRRNSHYANRRLMDTNRRPGIDVHVTIGGRYRDDPSTLGEHVSATRTVPVPALDHDVTAAVPIVVAGRRANVSLLDHDVSRRRGTLVVVVECDATLTTDANNRQPTRYE
jgi:hypothetical protein